MAEDDATDCARCGEAIRRRVMWWMPNLDRLDYLKTERGLGWFANAPEAPLCMDCWDRVDDLSEFLDTGASQVPGEGDPNENALTEFLDEVDIDEFRDAKM